MYNASNEMSTQTDRVNLCEICDDGTTSYDYATAQRIDTVESNSPTHAVFMYEAASYVEVADTWSHEGVSDDSEMSDIDTVDLAGHLANVAAHEEVSNTDSDSDSGVYDIDTVDLANHLANVTHHEDVSDSVMGDVDTVDLAGHLAQAVEITHNTTASTAATADDDGDAVMRELPLTTHEHGEDVDGDDNDAVMYEVAESVTSDYWDEAWYATSDMDDETIAGVSIVNYLLVYFLKLY
jgi:hypothetical protein